MKQRRTTDPPPKKALRVTIKRDFKKKSKLEKTARRHEIKRGICKLPEKRKYLKKKDSQKNQITL